MALGENATTLNATRDLSYHRRKWGFVSYGDTTQYPSQNSSGMVIGYTTSHFTTL